MNAVVRTVCGLAVAAGAGAAVGQSFHYVEPGVARCPAAPTAAAARTVKLGAAVSGSINVSCGFENGSYTVTLNSSDSGATFSPKTFVVNFGRVVGNGAFAVTFSTPGVHSIAATITSNMGSSAVQGSFASAVSAFSVVPP